jgi:transcriptional regulator with XRE-family HTH domain
MSAERETFAQRLRVLRARAGRGAEELADQAGVSRQALHRYETGRQYPTAPALDRIARALGVSLSAFDGCDYPSVPKQKKT